MILRILGFWNAPHLVRKYHRVVRPCQIGQPNRPLWKIVIFSGSLTWMKKNVFLLATCNWCIFLVFNYQYREKITHVGSSLPYLKINQQRTELQGHHALLQEVLPQNGWVGPQNEGSHTKKVGHSGLKYGHFLGILDFWDVTFVQRNMRFLLINGWLVTVDCFLS